MCPLLLLENVLLFVNNFYTYPKNMFLHFPNLRNFYIEHLEDIISPTTL